MLSKEGRRELTKGTRKGAMNWGKRGNLRVYVREGYAGSYIYYFSIYIVLFVWLVYALMFLIVRTHHMLRNTAYCLGLQACAGVCVVLLCSGTFHWLRITRALKTSLSEVSCQPTLLKIATYCFVGIRKNSRQNKC